MTTETAQKIDEKPFEINGISAKLPLVDEETNAETAAEVSKKPRESHVFNHGTGKVTFVQALKLITASRATLSRYTRDGKISFETDANGNKLYQAVELERVFGKLLAPETGETVSEVEGEDHEEPQQPDHETALRLALLEQENGFLRERAQRAEDEAESWKQQAERATLILTDQRAQPATTPKRGIFGAIFGGRSR